MRDPDSVVACRCGHGDDRHVDVPIASAVLDDESVADIVGIGGCKLCRCSLFDVDEAWPPER